MDDLQGDICRVCRCEAQSDRPLFYPCICTGSIKFIHQDCLMQWMRYSHKEYCELCGHRFSFQPIYSPDMPRVLPLRDVAGGLMNAVLKAAKSWFHYSLVGIAWFGVVPLSAYRTYRYIFRASTFDMILSLPFDVFSTENLASDAFKGCFVVTCTLLSFVGLVWLREQILHGGGPDWLEGDHAPPHINDADLEREENALNPDLHVVGQDVLVDAIIPEDNNNNNEELEALNNANGLEPVRPPIFLMQRNLQMDLENENDAMRVGVDGLENIHPQGPVGRNDNVEAEIGGDQIADNDIDEPNWNPMEWDRAAEELTWERLLGLDGSLVFLEHVFWIISLNTMFIFTFAFCPYCFGSFILQLMDLLNSEQPLPHFHGLITTLLGYCFIGLTLIVLHSVTRIFRLRRVRWFLGLCYIVVKVSLLSVVEIGVLPLVCGWWLDICSLPLFDASIKDRKASFKVAPGTSLFVHWMFGMVYVYYFAAFISLLREVLRPGVLWFLRNLNDPDFSPIQEMIHLPIVRHIRRLLASAMIFGSVVLLMLWVPIRILQTAWPNFLPYAMSGDSEVNELSLQLLLLQVILPGFFEQSHSRVWLKGLLRVWCTCVSWVLGLGCYLLGNNTDQTSERVRNVEGDHQIGHARNAALPRRQLLNPVEVAEIPVRPAQAERNLAAVHQAIIQREAPVGFQPYSRPSFFIVRLVGLLFFVCASLVIVSLVTLTVPIMIGRQVMAFWSLGVHLSNAYTSTNSEIKPINNVGNEVVIQRPHELYTAAVGTYLCWIVSRGVAIAVNLLPQGRIAVVQNIRQWIKVGASYALPAFIFVLMIGVIPLLFGLLLELIVVIPLRVPLYQTPVHFFGQDWALGVLYTKIAVALTLMGPDWRLKRSIERTYRDGLHDVDLKFLIRELAVPIIEFFGLALSIPYVLAHSILPAYFDHPVRRLEISRACYPVFFVVVAIIAYICFEINQFKKLYVAIKTDKYLVGQRLVNYEHRRRAAESMDTGAYELHNENVTIGNAGIVPDRVELYGEIRRGQTANVLVEREIVVHHVALEDEIL